MQGQSAGKAWYERNGLRYVERQSLLLKSQLGNPFSHNSDSFELFFHPWWVLRFSGTILCASDSWIWFDHLSSESRHPNIFFVMWPQTLCFRCFPTHNALDKKPNKNGLQVLRLEFEDPSHVLQLCLIPLRNHCFAVWDKKYSSSSRLQKFVVVWVKDILQVPKERNDNLKDEIWLASHQCNLGRIYQSLILRALACMFDEGSRCPRPYFEKI